jgi:hypothetical protein
MPALKINRYPISIEGETTLIGTANELAIALDVLQGQHDHEALAQLRPYLAEIIAHASGLFSVIRSLAVDEQIFLIQALGADLEHVMQNARHLSELLATMSDQKVEGVLLTTLGSNGLSSLISTGKELAEVLEWVYGEQDELVLELLGGDTMRRLCRNAADLSAVLHALDFDLQIRFLGHLGWPYVLNLVDDGRDLAHLLRALPPVNSEQLLRHFSGKRLKELIGHTGEWAYLYQRLEPAEAALILGMLDLS